MQRSNKTIAEDRFQFLETPHKADQWLRNQVKRTSDYLSTFKCTQIEKRIRYHNGRFNDSTIPAATTDVFSIRVKYKKKGMRFYIKKGVGRWRFAYALRMRRGKHELRASKDGRYLVVLTDTGGDEIFDIRVIDLLFKRQLPLVLPPVRFAELQWLKDSTGFIYKPHNENFLAVVKIESLEQFSIVLPEELNGLLKLNCFENKIVITGGAKRAAIVNLDRIGCRDANPAITFDYPLTDRRGRIRFLGSIDQSMIFLDKFDTSYSLLALNFDGTRNVWNTHSLVEAAGIVENAWLVGERSCVHLYNDDGSTIVIYDREGKELSNFLAAEAGDIHYASEKQPDEVTVGCSTLTKSTYQVKVNYKNDARDVDEPTHSLPPSIVTGRASVPPGPTPEIPLTFARRRCGGVFLKAPTILEVYGGYGMNLMPSFRPETAVWLERGGTVVLAHIRGGGEKGDDWCQQASGSNRQNSVDDIIRVAEWLVENDYCTVNQLGLRGVSYGGFLVAAAMTQRPDLFGAAIIESGPLDLVRRPYFGESSNWGHPSPLNANEIKYALALSPYHNLRRGVAYPPCMVITRANDHRVSPIHAFKFIAALQEHTRGAREHLLQYEPSGGHFATSSPDRGLAEATSWLSFAAHNLGMVCYAKICKDCPLQKYQTTRHSAPEVA